MPNYCHECGARLLAEDHPDETGKVTEAEVEIARIQANRDIRIAELAAREAHAETEAAVEISESEAEVEAAHAEGVAEGIETVIDAANPETSEGEPATIVVEAPAEEAEESAEVPPVIEPHEPPHREKNRNPWW